MINVPISLYDVLSVSLNPNNSGFSLTVDGDARGVFGDDISLPSNNILFKCYEEFSNFFRGKFALSVNLNKKIPIGGGLGGGSSDAASLLMYLSRKLLSIESDYHLHTGLLAIAAKLGADVPFFLAQKPCIVRGIGEELTPIEIPALTRYVVWVLLPPVKISTREVFAAYEAEQRCKEVISTEFIQRTPLEDLLYNDLFSPAMKIAPSVGALVKMLKAKELSCSMTGSGSGVFVLQKKGEKFPEDGMRAIAREFDCRILSCNFVNS